MNCQSTIPPSFYDPDPDMLPPEDIEKALRKATSTHNSLYFMALSAVRPLQPPAVHAALRLSQVVERYIRNPDDGDEAVRGLAAEAVCNGYLKE